MSVQLLSVIGNSQQMAITVAMSANGIGPFASYPPDTQELPTFPIIPNFFSGATLPFFKWTVDPTRLQSATNFGTIKTLSLCINRYAQFAQSNTTGYIPGRVFLRVSNTGQIFVFSPKQQLLLTKPPYGNSGFDDTNTVIPIRSLNTSVLEFWLEQDISNISSEPPQSIVYATIFNFDVHASGDLG